MYRNEYWALIALLFFASLALLVSAWMDTKPTVAPVTITDFGLIRR